MKEPQKNDARKPGLEEALHPEIGNDALWTNDLHSFSLSSVDPLKSIDEHIVNAEIKLNTLEHWNSDLHGESNAAELPEHELKEIKQQSVPENEAELIHETPESDTPLAPVFTEEHIDLPESEELDIAAKKEKKKKDKAVLKAGKRIRKVAEKMDKEEKKRSDEKLKIPAATPEPSLSPFTHWLKGLTGSEYVHPYEDDFAFHQGSRHAGEGISETFADLLAAQGYKDQAIAMYTQLMEKFPEKSRFFAAKIEALQ